MAISESSQIDRQIGERLKTLRIERGWSLEELSRHSKVSRATLSRLEKAEVSATATVLGRLCAAYGLPVSRLMRMVEEDFAPLMRHGAQPVWCDPAVDFRRRSVSPPALPLAGEVIECALGPGVRIAYEHPPRPGLEHHLLLREGRLAVEIEEAAYDLGPGDCLRYVLSGRSAFATPADSGARYILFIV